MPVTSTLSTHHLRPMTKIWFPTSLSLLNSEGISTLHTEYSLDRLIISIWNGLFCIQQVIRASERSQKLNFDLMLFVQNHPTNRSQIATSYQETSSISDVEQRLLEGCIPGWLALPPSQQWDQCPPLEIWGHLNKRQVLDKMPRKRICQKHNFSCIRYLLGTMSSVSSVMATPILLEA